MKFSIITITKNNPVGFAKTKISVDAQTYADFEWVVINGDVEPDNGIYDAMNKGIERSSGEYLIFMNAGDTFATRKTLSEIAICDADFIYGDAIEAGRVKRAKRHSKINGGMITHHQSMVYRRDIIGDLRYDERYKVAADYKFTLEFLRSAKTHAYINKPLCIFDIGGVSQLHAKLGRTEEIVIRKQMGVISPITPYRQWLGQVVKHRTPWLYRLRG